MTNEKDKKIYVTSDLALAAFLWGIKKLLLISCDNDGAKFNFVFEDPEEKAEKLKLEFMNSDIRHYDDAVRSLKKLLYDKKK